MNQLRRRGSGRWSDGVQSAANLMRCFCNNGLQLLASLPSLRRLQSVVGTLGTLLRSGFRLHTLLWSSMGNSLTRIVVAVLTALARRAGIQLSLAVGESSAAPLAGWLACLVDSCEETRRDEHRTCTAACTAERSIS